MPTPCAARSADAEFDVVAEFLAFTPEHVQQDLDLFEGRTGQYVFISSASAYQKPPRRLPVTESTPLRNPFWQYSRDKIACEDLLVAAYRERGFPVTIVRPSHTYDERHDPDPRRLDRHRADARRAGPSSSTATARACGPSRTPTTSRSAFTGLLGNPAAIGEAFTITGTHAPTWNQIYGWLADAAGRRRPDFVHVASETIAAFAPELGPDALGDKAHSVVFDNSKVTRARPGVPHHDHVRRGRAPDRRALRRAPRASSGSTRTAMRCSIASRPTPGPPADSDPLSA